MDDKGVDLQQGFAPALLERMQRALSRIDPDEDAPAMLVGMSKPRAQYIQPLGRIHGALPEADTQFEWGSISKTFTGMLLACAAMRGLLRLDEPLGLVLEEAAHLPRWLTLERIATHTACLPAQPPGIYRSWWRDRRNPWAHYGTEDLLAGVRKTKPPREKPANSAWRYSNFGYALLGAALERRTGETYATLVDEWLARPHGLSSLRVGAREAGGSLWPLTTGSGKRALPWDFRGAVAAAGALRGSMRDLMRWGMLIADPPSALRPTIELVRACRVDLVRAMGPMVGFCLGWSICKVPGSPHEVWAHEGATAGSLSVLIVSADKQPSVVALARNRGLGMRSVLERRARAIQPALFALSKLLQDAS